MTTTTHAIARKAIGIIAIAQLGAGTALALLRPDGRTISQWNGLCGTGAAQPLWFTSGDCRLAARADHAMSWFIVEGAALLCCYIALLVIRRTRQANRRQAPPDRASHSIAPLIAQIVHSGAPDIS